MEATIDNELGVKHIDVRFEGPKETVQRLMEQAQRGTTLSGSQKQGVKLVTRFVYDSYDMPR